MGTLSINEDPKAWAVAISFNSEKFKWPSQWINGGYRGGHYTKGPWVDPKPARRYSGIDLPAVPGHYAEGAWVPAVWVPGHLSWPKSRFRATILAFYQASNDWIIPVEIILFQNGKCAIKIELDSLHIHNNDLPSHPVHKLREAVFSEFKNYFVTKLSKTVWKNTLPMFDHNCKKRLYGFVQGKLYRMMDEEDFNPNFLVKRKIEVPQGHIDLIAKVIVEYVPIWEILRSAENDYWCTWQTVFE